MVDHYNRKMECDLNYCKQLLLSNFGNTWKRDIQKKPKLRTYCKVKKEYTSEKYVTLNLLSYERSVLAQFHTGTLPLQIELGRYAQIKLEERVCKVCTSGLVEDEFHFIFHCDAYQDERNTLFQNCNLNRTNTDEDIVKYLFDQYPRKFSKFLIKLLQIRKEKLT